VTLWGRRQQFRVLDELLADVRAGRSRVLVVRGEPGIGKTALLGYFVYAVTSVGSVLT
jgi:predicted ATPase